MPGAGGVSKGPGFGYGVECGDMAVYVCCPAGQWLGNGGAYWYGGKV
ncbi:hypothetical protein B4168_1269 [Anoxybacillus flavithermus]|nr:hypothetical protein B4168_1269 [Anoxybacillus flavithermus]OAO88583.1 hypothetical protein GT23_0239 [Parageobacillus thermoglucosidasius]